MAPAYVLSNSFRQGQERVWLQTLGVLFHQIPHKILECTKNGRKHTTVNAVFSEVVPFCTLTIQLIIREKEAETVELKFDKVVNYIIGHEWQLEIIGIKTLCQGQTQRTLATDMVLSTEEIPL